jgi:hypothetical protein
MSFVSFFNKSDKNKYNDNKNDSNKDLDKDDKDDRDESYDKHKNKYEKDYKEHNRNYDKNDRYNNRENKDDDKNYDRDNNRDYDRDDKDYDRDDKDYDRDYDRDDYRNSRDDRDDDRDDRNNNREYEDYDPRKDQSIKNIDKFFYKKNIQILKIFKMENRCIFMLVLLSDLGKCILIYIDPSKYKIECQNNNSIVGRENVYDISLYRINYKHVYELCDCYPELMKQTHDHRVNIENEKNKIYLTHFEQICIQLNNFKKIVKSSKSKLGIVTEFSISFINNDNEVELFNIVSTNPSKFCRMKTYLVYDLNTFMNNIDTINFEIERLVPSFTDELNKDNKDLRKCIESNSTLNNINDIKNILEELENKKKNLKSDSKKLEEMFKIAKRNLSQAKNKRENAQQRFNIEKINNTKQETMYLMMDIDDEYNNLLSHSLNTMHLIDKQCKNINEYIKFIKNYCQFK